MQGEKDAANGPKHVIKQHFFSNYDPTPPPLDPPIFVHPFILRNDNNIWSIKLGCRKITLIIQNLFHFKAMKKSLQESEIDILEYSKKIFSLTLPSPVRWQWWIFWYFGLALPPLFHPTFKVWFDLLLCSWFLGTRGNTWLKWTSVLVFLCLV